MQVAVEESDDGTSAAASNGVCGHEWRQAVQKILGPELQARKHGTCIKYGSDCSGLDAPYWGLSFLLEDMEAANKRTDRPGPCVGDVFAFAVF